MSRWGGGGGREREIGERGGELSFANWVIRYDSGKKGVNDERQVLAIIRALISQE